LVESTTEKQNFFRRFFLDPYLTFRSKYWIVKEEILSYVILKLIRKGRPKDENNKTFLRYFSNFMKLKSTWMILLGICGVATFSLSVAFLFFKQLCFTPKLFSFVKLIFAHNTIAITKLVLVMFFSLWVGLHCLIKGSLLGHQITKTIQSKFYRPIISPNEVKEEELKALINYYYYSHASVSSLDLLPSSELLSSTVFSRWATETSCGFGDHKQIHQFINKLGDKDGEKFKKYAREGGVKIF
jgi:hypothetical protein